MKALRVVAILSALGLAGLGGLPGRGEAQTAPAAPPAMTPAPSPAPSPAQPPASAPPAAPPAAQAAPPAAQAPPAAPPAIAAPVQAGRPTLIPTPGDPVNVDEVMLPEKQALVLAASSSWDDGYTSIRAAIARVESELARAGIAPAGRPLAIFTQTTDDRFQFEVMVPIGLVPTPAPTLPAGFRFGATPAGKAYRFVHQGPYEDIDSTYETVTSYLDAKDIAARDVFFEEYVNDVADPKDGSLEVNIFVQPR